MTSTGPHGSSDSARDRILACAMALFGQRGFDAVSVADIAQASGTSTSLIYYHFTDKRSLFETAVLEAADLMEAVASAELTGEGDPVERLTAFARAYSELLGSHPDTMRMLILSVASLEGRLPQQVLERAAAIIDGLARTIADGIDTGAFREVDTRQAATAFFAMTNAPITARALSVTAGFGGSAPADAGERMAEMFVRGILA